MRIADCELPAVKAVVDGNRDATLEELARLCGEVLGRSLSRATIGRAMVRLQLLAQKEGLIASERMRPSDLPEFFGPLIT